MTVAADRALVPGPVPMTAALALSWVGLYLHNLLELSLPLWRPENSLPLVISLALAIEWWQRPSRRTGLQLAAWVLLQLIAGVVLSVVPVGLYPFDPEQTLGHYGIHLLYGLLQVPLLVAVAGLVASPSLADRAASSDHRTGSWALESRDWSPPMEHS